MFLLELVLHQYDIIATNCCFNHSKEFVMAMMAKHYDYISKALDWSRLHADPGERQW
jgi:hypothetical protein